SGWCQRKRRGRVEYSGLPRHVCSRAKSKRRLRKAWETTPIRSLRILRRRRSKRFRKLRRNQPLNLPPRSRRNQPLSLPPRSRRNQEHDVCDCLAGSLASRCPRLSIVARNVAQARPLNNLQVAQHFYLFSRPTHGTSVTPCT